MKRNLCSPDAEEWWRGRCDARRLSAILLIPPTHYERARGKKKERDNRKEKLLKGSRHTKKVRTE